MPTTATSYTQFLDIVRERLQDAVLDLQMAQDGVGWRIMQNAEPIRDAGRNRDGSSTGLYAEWTISLQRSGYVSAGLMTGNTLQFLGTENLLATSQATDNGGYLDPLKAPLRSYVPITIDLKKIVGVVTVNDKQMETQMATTPLEEIAGGHVADQVRHLRDYWEEQIWSDGSAHLAQVNAAAGYSILESAPVAVTVDAGSPFNFIRGQRYVAGSAIAAANYGSSPRVAVGGTGPGAAGVMRCTNVDKVTREVYFQAEPGEGTITLTDNDVLMREGTYNFSAATVNAGTLAMQGIHGMLKQSGQFPGAPSGVTVQAYSELQSVVQDYSSGGAPGEVPTPELVEALLDTIDTGGSELPSLLVSERSVQTLYGQYERATNHFYIVPNGQTVSPTGGMRAPMFTHGDKAFVWPTSRSCRPNTLYGMEPGYMVRFMPIGDGSVRWKIGTGILSGYPNIFRPLFVNGNQLAGVAAADYESFGQFGIKRPNSFFIATGIKSQRDV